MLVDGVVMAVAGRIAAAEATAAVLPFTIVLAGDHTLTLASGALTELAQNSASSAAMRGRIAATYAFVVILGDMAVEALATPVSEKLGIPSMLACVGVFQVVVVVALAAWGGRGLWSFGLREAGAELAPTRRDGITDGTRRSRQGRRASAPVAGRRRAPALSDVLVRRGNRERISLHDRPHADAHDVYARAREHGGWRRGWPSLFAQLSAASAEAVVRSLARELHAAGHVRASFKRPRSRGSGARRPRCRSKGAPSRCRTPSPSTSRRVRSPWPRSPGPWKFRQIGIASRRARRRPRRDAGAHREGASRGGALAHHQRLQDASLRAALASASDADSIRAVLGEAWEALMSGLDAAVRYVLDLGAPVMMPILMTLLGLALGQGFARSFRGLTVGVGFVAIGLAVGLLVQVVGPKAMAFADVLGLKLDVLDVGWPMGAAVSFASPIAAAPIPRSSSSTSSSS